MPSVLTVNAGSSSLKLRLIGPAEELLGEEELAADRGRVDRGEAARAVRGLGEADAVGHRIVHGGSRFTGPVRMTDEVAEALRELTPLAPLHQPAALAAAEVVAEILSGTPAVACFDTSFHATLPKGAATYALPREWNEAHGLRRYGFHGLSHAYAARRAAELLGRPEAELRLVTCHLGAGASLAAVAGGRSVDTTMGFTPTEGLVMATRPGNVDPGLLAWLLADGGMGVDEVSDALEHRSGLLGLSGSADMREVLARSRDGDEAATLALEVYLHRLRASIAAMAAAMGGLDAVVFTGGVGEHMSEIRRGVADGLGFLGLDIGAEADVAAEPDADVSSPGARVAALVVRAREDLEIAAQVRQTLKD